MQHISCIVYKAKARASLILKCFISNDANTLVKAYTVYVRPLLEYNCHHFLKRTLIWLKVYKDTLQDVYFVD